MFDPLPDWIRQVRSQIPSDRVSNVSGIQSGPQSRSLLQQGNVPWLALNNLIFGENEILNDLILQEMLPEIICDSFGVEYPFPVPPDEEIWGPINVGFSEETGAPAGIYPKEVHFLVVGASGMGKSTLFRNIIRQHIDAEEPVLIIDFQNEYPYILRDNGINKLGIDNLKFNPLEVPPGMDPGLYMQRVCSIIADQCGLLIASKSFLLEAIDRLYTLFGVYNGSRSFPSMYELRDLLTELLKGYRATSRFTAYGEVCLNRIKGFILSIPKVLDCSVGMPFHLLTRGNLILLLHGIDFEYQSLLVTLILMWLCSHRIANGLRNNPEHNLAVFIDEAQRLFDSQLERRLYQGVPTISHLVATVRKYNLKLFVAAQQPTLLASSIKANSFCKVMLALGEGNDKLDMGSSMFLTPEQIYFSRMLETGQAIVKLAGRWHEPFVVRIPFEE